MPFDTRLVLPFHRRTGLHPPARYASKSLYAAFFADRNQRGVPITKMEQRHLSMLRNQLVLAFKYRRPDH